MKLFLLAFSVTTIVYSLLLIIKSEISLKNHIKILYAIDSYVEETKNYGKGLDLIHNVEPVIQTTFRIWDWGYKNILHKEDFELIKPYIKEK